MILSHTEHEMLETKEIFQNFDLAKTKLLAEKIGTKRVIFSGMGSSLIFPGKQAKHRALSYNLQNRVEVYFSSDLLQYTDFSGTFLFLCSNSGNTKEVLLLLKHAKAQGAICIGITTVSDSPLAKQCDEIILLSGGFEKGVAATKSVVEQALIYDSLIFHLAKQQGKNVDIRKLQRELKNTGEILIQNIELPMGKGFIKAIVEYPQYFFVGLDTGVAEELTLKMIEMARKSAFFYPDTFILHGPAEAIDQGIMIIVDPNQFNVFAADFEEFSKKTSTRIIRLGDRDILFTSNKTFKNYCLLAGGWGLLRNIANYSHIDIDSPQKISKIGVPYEK